MSPFPGIPEEALAELDEPDPVALGRLRQTLAPMASPPDGPLGALVEYGRLLLAARRVVNLTGARDWVELLEGHFVDCVLAGARVPEDARLVADWGSGGGLPGLVWAILMPEKRFLLLERTGKKAAFLEEAALRLGLANVDVLQGQAEEILRRLEERPDVLVARAVEPLPRLLARIRRNRIQHRLLLVMAGPRWEAAWQEVEPELKASWALAARHAYELGPGRGWRWLLAFHPR